MPAEPLPLLVAILAGGACAVGAVYWAVFLHRVRRMQSQVPRLEEALAAPPPPEGWPTVSVVIPVHNEARTIAASVRGLLAQDYPRDRLEIVYVLDRCSDETPRLLAEAAEGDPRIRTIVNESCPPGWAGKCHAAARGAAAATGRLLLFSDADVRLGPGLLRAAVATAASRRSDLLSLLGRLGDAHWFERVLQPVAALSLMRMFPLDRANRERSPRGFANGQFMLFRREAYEAIGGHAAVREDLLEDLAFARRLAAEGRRLGVAAVPAMMEVRMYASFAAMRAGWRRIFIEACGRSPRRLRRYAIRLAGATLLAPAILAAAIASVAAASESRWFEAAALGGLALAAMAAQTLALAAAFRQMAVPLAALPWFAPGALVLARELWAAADDLAHGRPIRWGGRDYVVHPQGRPAAVAAEEMPSP